MPWRETRDPYAIWLSETMLQQTQVETVKPYYRKFLERFPTVADLAAAELEEVLALWAGLGYYRRAKHLHLAAREMVAKHGGRVPGTLEELLSLPGVGRYTAGAVGSIAFGLAVPVVDGNVMRVVSRLTGFEGDIAEPRNAGFFWGVMEEILNGLVVSGEGLESREAAGQTTTADASIPAPHGVVMPFDGVVPPRKPTIWGARYGDLNQAVMELGATVCVPPPGVPGCLVCPVRAWCRASAEGGGRVMELPVKRKKGAVAEVRGVALVVTRNTKRKTQNAKPGGERASGRAGESAMEVLLMKRPMGGVWEGMWEFPVVEASGEVRAGREKREPQSRRDTEERASGRPRDEIQQSRDELHLDVSIKNGPGLKLKGKAEWGRGVNGDNSGSSHNSDIGGGSRVDGVMESVEEVVGAMGLRVGRVVRCGEVRHQLTHRLMVFEVVRVEVENAKLKTQNSKRGGETRNMKRETRNDREEVVLPGSVTAGGGRYVEMRWVGWPLERESGLPLAKVVWKVAEAAEE